MALPIAELVKPATLAGQANGKLDPAILTVIDGQDGGPKLRLVKPAALAWIAMAAAALAEGIVLKAVSAADSYRIYDIQERIFRERYTTTYLPGRPRRSWQGQWWYQRPGTAAAAVPGTSNHGWALAIDVDLTDKRVLPWLLRNAARFGFSWEIQSEAWHVRFVAGDRLPDAVAAAHGPVQPPEEDDMPAPLILTSKDGPHPGAWWAVDAFHRRYIATVGEAAGMAFVGSAKWNNGGPFETEWAHIGTREAIGPIDDDDPAPAVAVDVDERQVADALAPLLNARPDLSDADLAGVAAAVVLKLREQFSK